MKKFNYFLVVVAMIIATGCSNEDSIITQLEEKSKNVDFSLTVNAPEGEGLSTLKEARVSFTNRHTGDKFVSDIKEGNIINTQIPEGLYDIHIEADATKTIKGEESTITLLRDMNNVSICELRNKQTVELNSSTYSEGLKLLALYFRGSTKKSNTNSQYYQDKFFVIYNNGPNTVNIKDLAILEGEFVNTKNYNALTPDMRATHFAAGAVYKVPVSRKLKAGKYLVFCDQGIDHSQLATSEINLNHPKYFEWVDYHSNPNVQDTDNPNVPNLKKLYCYTATIWTPHMVSHKSFALARITADSTAFNNPQGDYYYPYSQEYYHNGDTIVHSMTARKVPNSDIIDLVNVGGVDLFNHNHYGVLDTGHTFLPMGIHSRCVKRYLQVTENGIHRYKDTNNSTVDFDNRIQVNNMNNLRTLVNIDFFDNLLIE